MDELREPTWKSLLLFVPRLLYGIFYVAGSSLMAIYVGQFKIALRSKEIGNKANGQADGVIEQNRKLKKADLLVYCEQCREASVFADELDGTTQACTNCAAAIDVARMEPMT